MEAPALREEFPVHDGEIQGSFLGVELVNAARHAQLDRVITGGQGKLRDAAVDRTATIEFPDDVARSRREHGEHALVANVVDPDADGRVVDPLGSLEPDGQVECPTQG